MKIEILDFNKNAFLKEPLLKSMDLCRYFNRSKKCYWLLRVFDYCWESSNIPLSSLGNTSRNALGRSSRSTFWNSSWRFLRCFFRDISKTPFGNFFRISFINYMRISTGNFSKNFIENSPGVHMRFFSRNLSGFLRENPLRVFECFRFPRFFWNSCKSSFDIFSSFF